MGNVTESIEYGLWDARYRSNPDASHSYEWCGDLEEAQRNLKDWPRDTVMVKHTLQGNRIVKSEIIN